MVAIPAAPSSGGQDLADHRAIVAEVDFEPTAEPRSAIAETGTDLFDGEVVADTRVVARNGWLAG